ncbi:unnamed protein product [Rotaria magnacalcarata]|uniref:Uncharacterized protein n=1 Tax=Rotaria magnacalcarata TaxID=392030 RepID=A0A8S3I069_9BILA|nr:unnamed protein product [Rotaria magnacalcarata]
MVIYSNIQAPKKIACLIASNNVAIYHRTSWNIRHIYNFIHVIEYLYYNDILYDMNKSSNVKAIKAFLKTLTEFLLYLITISFYSNTLVSHTNRLKITPLNASVNTKITTFPIATKRIYDASYGNNMHFSLYENYIKQQLESNNKCTTC